MAFLPNQEYLRGARREPPYWNAIFWLGIVPGSCFLLMALLCVIIQILNCIHRKKYAREDARAALQQISNAENGTNNDGIEEKISGATLTETEMDLSDPQEESGPFTKKYHKSAHNLSGSARKVNKHKRSSSSVPDTVVYSQIQKNCARQMTDEPTTLVRINIEHIPAEFTRDHPDESRPMTPFPHRKFAVTDEEESEFENEHDPTPSEETSFSEAETVASDQRLPSAVVEQDLSVDVTSPNSDINNNELGGELSADDIEMIKGLHAIPSLSKLVATAIKTNEETFDHDDEEMTNTEELEDNGSLGNNEETIVDDTDSGTGDIDDKEGEHENQEDPDEKP